MPKTAQEQENLKEQFKKDILEALLSFDQKICSVKDLAKAYRELKGQNVNVVIDELEEETLRPGKSGNFWHFLKFNCQAFCDVFQNDGDFRVLRTNDVEKEDDKNNNKKKAKKQPKAAPKLNLGRHGVINDFSFPRLNPQGFAKTAAANGTESKPAMSTAGLKTNYASVYRSAKQLKEFETQDEPSEGQNHFLAPTVYYHGSTANLFAYEQDEQSDDSDDNDEYSFEDDQPKVAPSVSNPFDFPALSENVASETSDNLNGQKGSLACLNQENQLEVKSFVEIAKATESPTAERQQEKSPCTSPELLDDPVFRFIYPDVVTDPLDGIPKLKVLSVDKRILFDVSLTNIYSPKQFWFQCCDRSFDMLCNRMNKFYSEIPADGLVISKQNAKRGLVVAVKVQSSWYRARVIEEANDNDEIFLFYVDFGICSLCATSDVRYLLKAFARDPAKALRGSLVEVSPKSGSDWANNDRILFFNVVACKKLFASIRYHHKDEDVYELELSKTVSGPSNDVAELLVNLGCAQLDDSLPTTSFAIPIAINGMSQLEI